MLSYIVSRSAIPAKAISVEKIIALLAVIGFVLLLSGCASESTPAESKIVPASRAWPTIRFLLTFDDGPSAFEYLNSTLSILDSLANNDVQSGIKAVFFVQTRAANSGGAALGRKILQREKDEGHLLGFHTATARHSNHRFLDPEEFEQSLTDGIADITAITGVAPKLVRPPFWNYDQRTFSAYQKHGMHVLLADLSANDGKIWGVNFSLRRRSNLLQKLTAVREQIAAGGLPAVNADIPVIVVFHDTNSYTARHMEEYLQILVDCARELGLPTANKPFYDDRSELERAAIARTIDSASQVVRLPGFWNWLWNE
jgi:peptidoglycan/xylan/chitin deacetylase (PgdA/CDA1 family)